MQFSMQTPTDFGLFECVQSHGWRKLAPFRWLEDGAALERTEETSPGEAATIRVAQDADTLLVDIDGPANHAIVEERVRRMLQLDLPMDAFHAFCAAHPELAHIPGLRQGRMLRSPTLFEDVVKVIATTNTTWAQTIAMTQRIVDGFGTLDERTGRRAFPRPEQIAAVAADVFAETARMGYRNGAVHAIATEIAERRLDLESWQDKSIPDADLRKRLLSLPGIGPYAASCLMIYLGRYSRVNVDSWARMMVGKQLGRAVNDREVHAFFEPYGEWQALVYHFYPWAHEEPAY